MNSTPFSPKSKSSSKIDGNQITFGAIDFQPHPPTLAPIFANLDQEMDMTIGSFNFRVGSLGSVRLSDPINLGLSAGKTAIVATSEVLVGSSSKVNSLVSIKPMKIKGSTIEELDKIMETLDLEESSGYPDTASDKNLGNINNHSEENFVAYRSDVSSNSEGAWMPGLKLHDDEQIIPSSHSSQYASNRHQMYVIINDTSKEFDAKNNLVINPQNIERGANHRVEGETDPAIATREKVHLSAAEW
jgi:hypothetical protein